jgi:MFS transporter, DHA2 family, methylenomycin A resistance protein
MLTPTVARPVPTEENEVSQPNSRRALFVICFGFFLVLLDTTALNVAVPDLGREFGQGLSSLQWVVNSYTLVFASLLLAGGALGDRIGSRTVYQLGLALFGFSSLASALAPSLPILIVARVAQGLGAALMLPASLALLSQIFTDLEQRSHAVSVWANTVSIGFAAGPSLGGVLTSALGWRSIFWLNVPVALIAIWLNHRFIPNRNVAKPRPIDWSGHISLGLALLALTDGFIQAGRVGWLDPSVLLAFGTSGVLVAFFLYCERRSSWPVLPDFLFKQRLFSYCLGVGFALNFGMYGILFVESIYLQNVKELSPWLTGLVITPFTLFPTLASRALSRRNGPRYIRVRLVSGFAVAVIGSVFLVLGTGQSGMWAIVTGLSGLGIGMGIIMPAMTAGVLISSPQENSGLASGALNSLRQMGGTVGVALLGTLLQPTKGFSGVNFALGLTGLVFFATAAVVRRGLRGPGVIPGL